jgi:GT2 family glycosyltransferase
MSTIGIVIPIYNRVNLTIEGLKSVNEALSFYYATSIIKNFKFKIIVVDDGSRDGSSDAIKEHFSSVIVLQGSGNLWWSGAINAGAKYAVEILEADFVLLWNDDTTCAKDYFYELVLFLTNNVQYQKSIIISKIFWLHQPNLLFNFGCYYNHSTGKQTLIGLNKEDTFDAVISVDWSGGMGTLIPKEILVNVNYFDSKNFPQYFGDCDFFLRAKKAGFKAYGAPKLKIYNNIESTGINKVNSLKDLKNILTSIRSNDSIKQNFKFVSRHSNTFLSWSKLAAHYLSLVTKGVAKSLVKTIPISSLKKH